MSLETKIKNYLTEQARPQNILTTLKILMLVIMIATAYKLMTDFIFTKNPLPLKCLLFCKICVVNVTANTILINQNSYYVNLKTCDVIKYANKTT